MRYNVCLTIDSTGGHEARGLGLLECHAWPRSTGALDGTNKYAYTRKSFAEGSLTCLDNMIINGTPKINSWSY